MRRLAAIAVLLLAFTGLGVPRPAAAAPAACSGVWVVVESSVRCADTFSNGLVALRSAGYQVETTGGMICRINGAPATCVVASAAYWSYWHAKRNADGTYGAWTYSNKGAEAYRPAQGDAEGWTFGSGKSVPPGRPPAAPIAPPTQPAPPPATTRPATSTSTKATTAPTGTQAATTQAAPPAGRAPTPDAAPSAASAEAVASAVPTAAAALTPDTTAGAGGSPTPPAPAASPKGPSGPATAVFALGALALGGVGTAWAVKRRRLT